MQNKNLAVCEKCGVKVNKKELTWIGKTGSPFPNDENEEGLQYCPDCYQKEGIKKKTQ